MTKQSNELSLFDSYQIVYDLKEYNIELKLFILRLNRGLFIWLGNQENKLSGLSVCLPSSLSMLNQHTTTIYSVADNNAQHSFGDYEENIACKISKRFNCPTFVSISLPYEFTVLWNKINVLTQNTFGQKVEQFIIDNLSTIKFL
ncbi:unnamed protein product [Schistosoma turkestanicum]|nr:unnamed protein product [Schistosoma turkestanicum]